MTAATDDRPHNYARYKNHGCRCYACCFAVSQYRLRVEREQRKGTWQPFVDAEPARQHLRRLMATGVGKRRAASLAGLTESCVSKLLYGQRGKPPTQRLRPQTAARILAIPVAASSMAPGANVDPTGTRRRIEALGAMGWSLTVQAERIGWRVTNFAVMMRRPTVAASTAAAVASLYDRCSMTPAPESYGRSRIVGIARRKGWFPPLAWDDETIDDPAALPVLLPPAPGDTPHADELAIQHRMAGHDRPITRDGEVELIRRLVSAGWQIQRIAEFTGRSRYFVEQARDGKP